jgi:hypothetical protein
MTEGRILLVLIAAVAAGFAATNFTIAKHSGGGGEGHNHAIHSDGNGGTWHMQDDQVRHCLTGTATEKSKCEPWQ